MKHFAIICCLCLFLGSCSSRAQIEAPAADAVDIERTENHIGQTINPEGAMSMTELAKAVPADKPLNAKVKGSIVGVCKVKGCWMTMKNEAGEDMRVTFKDYGFFMPMDIDDGREATIQGVAQYETTPVELLRHLAEDAGDSPEEIAKITEPKRELVFEASGVYLSR